MVTVNIDEPGVDLAHLVERVTKGESFVIEKEGKPLAVVAPYEEPKLALHRVGFYKDIKIPENFDEMCKDEILAMFEGEE